MPAPLGAGRAARQAYAQPLPVPGAVGRWYFDQYQATPRPLVPNAVSSAPTSKNLISATRGMLQTNSFWSVSGTTVTDGQTAADGTPNASNVVIASGSAAAGLSTSLALTSGATYTMAADISTTDGTSTQIAFGASPSFSTITATPTPTTFSVTFVAGSGSTSVYFARSYNTTAANLRSDNLRLFAGSADLGADVLAGHLMLGVNATSSVPTITGGIVDLSTGGGVIQFGSALNLNNFTVTAVCARNKATNGYFSSLLSSVDPSYSRFIAEANSGTVGLYPNSYAGGTAMKDNTQGGNIGGLWHGLRIGEYDTVTIRYDGTYVSYFLGDILATRTPYANLTTSTKNFLLSWVNGANFAATENCLSIAFFATALSDALVRQEAAFQKYRAKAVQGVSADTLIRFINAEGDSITYGSSSSSAAANPDVLGSHSNRYGVVSNPPALGTVNAVSSAQLGLPTDAAGTNTLWGRYALDLAFIPPQKKGRIFTLTIMIGRNDLTGSGVTASNYAARLGAYCLAMRAGGYDRIGVQTVLPSTLANFNTVRNAFNSIIVDAAWRAQYGVDVIIDVAADPTMGPDSAASDTSLYNDGTHPSAVGYKTILPILRDALNALG